MALTILIQNGNTTDTLVLADRSTLDALFQMRPDLKQADTPYAVGDHLSLSLHDVLENFDVLRINTPGGTVLFPSVQAQPAMAAPVNQITVEILPPSGGGFQSTTVPSTKTLGEIAADYPGQVSGTIVRGAERITDIASQVQAGDRIYLTATKGEGA